MTDQGFAASENEDFSKLIDDFLGKKTFLERCLARGVVREVSGDDVRVEVRSDTGEYMAEGYVDLREFKNQSSAEPGQEIDIYIDNFEGRDGSILISYEKARRERLWGLFASTHRRNFH